MSNLDQKNFDKENISEVDLTYLFNFFKRKSILIIVLTSFISIIGGFLNLQIKPTYQGDFKIYGLNNSEVGFVLLGDLLNKYGLSSNASSQKYTLNRSSLLKPVFEKYNKKIKRQANSSSTFSNWRKNFNFVDDSEVFTITFKDKNKNLLIETLKDLKLEYENTFSKNNKIQLKNATNIIKARFLLETLQKNENLENKELSLNADEILEQKNILNNLLKTMKVIKSQKDNYSNTFSDIETYRINDNKIRFLLTTTIISFLLISFIFLLIEFFSKKIYDFDILKINIDAKYLGDIYYDDQINSKILLSKIINQNNIKSLSIGLLIPDSISDKKIDLLKYLKDLDINFKQIKISNLYGINNFDKIIIVTYKGSSSYKDIELLNNYIHIYGEIIKGWVFIK